MICSTFTNPFWLSADDTSAIAAERCVAFISFRLMPPRRTKLVGKFDQRARCCASSKANRTLCRCFASSVARNLSAALTILEVAEVAVCPAAAVTEIPTVTKAPATRIILIEKTPIVFSLPAILNRVSLTLLSPQISEDWFYMPDRLHPSALIDENYPPSPTRWN
jgi:hypothetical protein